MIRTLAGAALAFAFAQAGCTQTAFAQTATGRMPSGVNTSAGRAVAPAPVDDVGYDPVAGSPCMLGSSPTCTTAPRLLGVGALQAVPAGSTNGSVLGAPPSGAIGVRFYLAASDSVTFTVAGTAPTSAPAVTFLISGASGGTGPNWDENLSAGQMIYVTATSGAPKFRWF